LSIAWAVAEHLATSPVARPKTLFATHYHELTDLSSRFKGVKNQNVAVREWEDQVIFLHRIVEGGTDRSYGIHVARLAGVPKEVIERARQLLGELSVQHVGRPKVSRSRKSDRQAQIDENQLPLFTDPAKELLTALAGTRIEELSPMQALQLLAAWKDKWGKG
jgi:DNA mismatch repair protein MutS